jgi:hypothetical protein
MTALPPFMTCGSYRAVALSFAVVLFVLPREELPALYNLRRAAPSKVVRKRYAKHP